MHNAMPLRLRGVGAAAACDNMAIGGSHGHWLLSWPLAALTLTRSINRRPCAASRAASRLQVGRCGHVACGGDLMDAWRHFRPGGVRPLRRGPPWSWRRVVGRQVARRNSRGVAEGAPAAAAGRRGGKPEAPRGKVFYPDPRGFVITICARTDSTARGIGLETKWHRIHERNP